jgi:CRP-like cAMP-binding protein
MTCPSDRVGPTRRRSSHFHTAATRRCRRSRETAFDIPAGLWREALLAKAFAEETCKRLRRTSASVQQAVSYGVEERLADCLLHLTAPSGRITNGARIAVWQHELATITGVTRSSINRQPRSRHVRGLVSIGRVYIDLIDPAAVAAIAAGPSMPGHFFGP